MSNFDDILKDLSEEEAQEWEEGGDPCQVVIKINENSDN
jgi:hypothetical protein